MSNTATIEPSIPSFEPVEALRDEQTQLETWVHQSFSALERLHSELNEWQEELTNQQSALDKSQASLAESQTSLARCEVNEQKFTEQNSDLQQELKRCREERSQLEEENTVLAKDYEELDRRHAAVLAELSTVRQFADQMAAAQETQQEQASQQQHRWTGELKEMRQLLERHYELLDEKLTTGPKEPPAEVHQSALPAHVEEATDTDSEHDKEIRRRAKTRRAAKRRESGHSE